MAWASGSKPVRRMRRRLVAAVLALTLVLIALAAGARAVSVIGDARAETSLRLTQDLRLISWVVADAAGRGEVPDEALLQRLVPTTAQLVYEPAAGEAVVVEGEDHDGPTDDDVRASLTVTGATLTLSEPGNRLGSVILGDPAGAVALLLLLVAVCVVGGLAIAEWLGRPFRQLAVAVRDLSRGRLEPRLPTSSMTEVRAIAHEVRGMGEQLRERLTREQQFAARASHELRTPLTRVRLSLDELAMVAADHPEVPGAVEQCLAAVADAERVSGELVALMWRDGVLSGLTSPVQVLATELTQLWADRLDRDGRTVTAAVEGDPDAEVGVGQAEAVLERLLDEVVRSTVGEVRLVFETREGEPLRVQVLCAGVRRQAGEQRGLDAAEPTPLERARELAVAMGGRLDGDSVDGLRLTLPRR